MNGKTSFRELGQQALQNERSKRLRSARTFEGRGSVRRSIIDHIRGHFYDVTPADIETPESVWLEKPLLVDVSIDGVELVASCRAYVEALRMRGHCPLCGDLVLSKPVGGFLGLGELLDRFQPDPSYHACRQPIHDPLCAEQEAAIAKATEAMREALSSKE